MRDQRLSGIARAAWPHIAKLLMLSGLAVLLFAQPHPAMRVLSAPAPSSEVDMLELLDRGEVVEVAGSVLAGLDIRTGERTRGYCESTRRTAS